MFHYDTPLKGKCPPSASTSFQCRFFSLSLFESLISFSISNIYAELLLGFQKMKDYFFIFLLCIALIKLFIFFLIKKMAKKIKIKI